MAFDPLDGSSIVDTNFTVGTIFGVYPGDKFLGKTGRDQVGFWYIPWVWGLDSRKLPELVEPCWWGPHTPELAPPLHPQHSQHSSDHSHSVIPGSCMKNQKCIIYTHLSYCSHL